MHLAADERETRAELAHGVKDPVDHALLELTLGRIAVDGEELERVGVLRELLRLVGVQPLERAGEVAWRSGLPLVQAGRDLVSEHRPAPLVVCVLRGVPVARLLVVELVEQLDHVSPRQLCNGSLHNLSGVRPGTSEGPHVEQVPAVN